MLGSRMPSLSAGGRTRRQSVGTLKYDRARIGFQGEFGGVGVNTTMCVTA